MQLKITQHSPRRILELSGNQIDIGMSCRNQSHAKIQYLSRLQVDPFQMAFLYLAAYKLRVDYTDWKLPDSKPEITVDKKTIIKWNIIKRTEGFLCAEEEKTRLVMNLW